jgi:hypothetical protein
VTDAPAEVEVEDDERLRLVLALYREGLTSESPFYRFLSLWNALDAVFNNNVDAMTEFVNAHAPSLAAGREGYDPPPDNWASYCTTRTETQSRTRSVGRAAPCSTPTRPATEPACIGIADSSVISCAGP